MRYHGSEMARILSVYLDACALNRLTDPPSHARIALEAAAVEQILLSVQARRLHWIASLVLRVELARNRDQGRRETTLGLLQIASEMRSQTRQSLLRGKQLEKLGFGPFDALHLAVAEESGCDVLLTTDDRFRKLANRIPGAPSVQVRNPLNYLQEVRP
jgi:predicted nucleic acid-binding protein